MMELKDRFIINSLIGTLVGIIVGIFTWMINIGNMEGRSFVLHIVMSGIHGLIPCGAVTVYAMESWGLTKSTIVHATITLATIMAIELPMKWFRWNIEFAIMMIIYVVIYTIIWFINYSYWKHTIRKLNEELKYFKKNEE